MDSLYPSNTEVRTKMLPARSKRLAIFFVASEKWVNNEKQRRRACDSHARSPTSAPLIATLLDVTCQREVRYRENLLPPLSLRPSACRTDVSRWNMG